MGDTLAQVLELNGHRVRVARDGKSGIALALELQPDVILCDIGLPDTDGYEVARELRQSERLQTHGWSRSAVMLSMKTGTARKRRASTRTWRSHRRSMS